VDVILDLMIHDIDIILHFTKSPLKAVDAVGVPVLSDKIDIANVRLTFENGCVANITASRISTKTMQKSRFFGIDSYHAVDYEKRELVSLGRVKTSEGRYDIVQNPSEIRMHDPLEEEIRSFLRACINRTQPAVTGRDGRDALAVAALIIEKMKTL
jgi:predicted dehydrogenase